MKKHNAKLTPLTHGYAPGSTYSTNPLFMKSGANYYYYQNDHLGTPQKLVTQSGQVVWSATYDAFGSATVGAGYTLTNNLRLPGQYFDQETGMHYNWMRYYDPKSGRYVTSDPIGLMSGVNIYIYVNGNPISLIDPDGLDAWWTDPGMRFKNPKNVPLNPQQFVHIHCVQKCYSDPITITATTNGHTEGPHVNGKAIDFTVPSGSSGANSATCCALECGAVFVQDEYHYPSKNSTGGHIHSQSVPGKDGATRTGSKPKPKCDKCPSSGG